MLTQQEIMAMVARCNKGRSGTRNKALIVVLWRCGLRVSEALDLRPSDIKEGVLTVRCGKGGKRRVLGVDPTTQAFIDVWMATRPESDYIFCTLKGGRMSRRYVWGMTQRVGNINPHMLRHAFACDLCDEHTDIRVVQKALGHQWLSTTQRYVDHLRPTAIIDALKARAWEPGA